MTESIITGIITVSSMFLLCYWFRYTCLLILSTKTARDYVGDVAAANQLGFLDVQSRLRAGSPELDRLRETLDRDYEVLTRILTRSAESGMEERMLGMDYRFMGAWYRVSSPFSPAAARQALEEMSMIVAHFANTMGERAAGAAAA